MKIRSTVLLLFCVGLFACCSRMRADAPPAPATPHAWQRIHYVNVPMPGTPDKTMGFTLFNGGPGDNPYPPESSQLRFDLTFGTSQSEPIPPAIAQLDQFKVRMHLPDGTIIPVAADMKNWLGVSAGPGYFYSAIYFLPWARNVLDEAWIEVVMPGQTYWLEVPYGFTRKPSAPLTPEAPRRGPPALAPAMKGMPAADRIVPWTAVDYSLGTIQNGWSLSASIGNPYDPEAEITLQRGTDPDKNQHFDTTRTDMRMGGFSPLGGVNGRKVNIHLGWSSRSDVFLFNSNPPDDTKERGWGKATVVVDDQTWECVIPSSLFCTPHGKAEPNNPQRIRPPKDSRLN